jgi:hypothetical protein
VTVTALKMTVRPALASVCARASRWEFVLAISSR